MNSKKLINSSFGLSHQGNGLSQQFENQTIIFDSFLDAKGGSKGGGTNNDGSTDTTPVPVITDTYISGSDLIDDINEFNIHIDFYGDLWTDALKEDFINSADFLSTLITDDIAPNGFDDITIDASLIDIDGADGTLGRAGPTHIWNDNLLTSKAIMEFDVADAADFDNLGLWDDIVLHEMIHTLGFGTLWDYHNLVATQIDDNGTKKPTDDIVTSVFTGEMASHYEILDNANPLVETDGGSGTAGGHWDEETYGNELMTGYIDNPNELTLMTYGSLVDMGYVIDDAFFII